MNIGLILLSLPKTVYYNLKLFPLKDALRIPIVFSYSTYLKGVKKGSIELKNIDTGRTNVGFYEGIGGNNARKTIIEIKNGGRLSIGGKACIAAGSYLQMDGGLLQIGKDFHGGANLRLIARKKITIGENVLTSWNCTIMDSDGHDIQIDGESINFPREVNIGNNVWLGMDVTIFKGAQIPDSVVIGAGCKVLGKLPCSNAVYAEKKGEICVVKENTTWKR